MQGFHFLILSDKKLINHGVIVQRITAKKYLCEFARNPTVCRVCSITEIQGWNLFPSENLMNAFITAFTEEKENATKETQD